MFSQSQVLFLFPLKALFLCLNAFAARAWSCSGWCSALQELEEAVLRKSRGCLSRELHPALPGFWTLRLCSDSFTLREEESLGTLPGSRQ